MSLIKCKECGKEISDKAEICPNCGYILKSVEIKSELKQKKSIKKIGTILCVIGSLLLIVFMALILILPGQQENNNEKADFKISVIIGGEQETNSEMLAICYFGSGLVSIVILILGILDLKKIIKNIKIYGWIELILSILLLVLMCLSLNCCQIVFIFCPLICFIGSIMILIGNMKDIKNELQDNS